MNIKDILQKLAEVVAVTDEEIDFGVKYYTDLEALLIQNPERYGIVLLDVRLTGEQFRRIQQYRKDPAF